MSKISPEFVSKLCRAITEIILKQRSLKTIEENLSTNVYDKISKIHIHCYDTHSGLAITKVHFCQFTSSEVYVTASVKIDNTLNDTYMLKISNQNDKWIVIAFESISNIFPSK